VVRRERDKGPRGVVTTFLVAPAGTARAAVRTRAHLGFSGFRHADIERKRRNDRERLRARRAADCAARQRAMLAYYRQEPEHPLVVPGLTAKQASRWARHVLSLPLGHGTP
jgi:hypothetical protein